MEIHIQNQICTAPYLIEYFPVQMSEEQALVIVETVKALLDGAEQELEEEAVSVLIEAYFSQLSNALQMREMIVERKMEEAAAIEEAREEAEREAMYRRLVQASAASGIITSNLISDQLSGSSSLIVIGFHI